MKFNKGVKPMGKKLLSALLSLALIVSLAPTVAYATSDETTTSANALYQLGLFNGVGTDANGSPIFQLDRQPTRNEAVTMLVRLLGKEEEAKSKEWSTPFTDLDAWVKPYVGYAYNNGLTTGTSGTTFGGSGIITSSQYITFVLRALGYKDGVDFQWDKAWELSDKLGFTKGQYTQWGVQEYVVSGDINNPIPVTRWFLRGDVAIISYNALSMKLKGTDTTLLANVKGNTSDVGEHTHVYVTKTVPGSGGHYEQVITGYKTEPVYETYWEYECKWCERRFDSFDAYDAHYRTASGNLDFTNECVLGGNYMYERKRQVGENQVPVYENKWIEDAPTTIRVCSICGQQEP